jgi:hypothetical protein
MPLRWGACECACACACACVCVHARVRARVVGFLTVRSLGVLLHHQRTTWAQRDLQTKFNNSGARCDLFAVPGVGHSSLFPDGNVTTRNGVPIASPVPVLAHSYGWIADAMGLNLI